MKNEPGELFLTILGFFTSFTGFGAIYGSFRVEFWLSLAETIRFMVVFLLFTPLSIGLFVLTFKKITLRLQTDSLKINRMKTGSVFLLFLIFTFFISYLTFGTDIFGAEFRDLPGIVTVVMSGLLFNNLIAISMIE